MNVTEKEAIDLLGKGWELGRSPISGNLWMQENGLGSGGNSKNMDENVLTSLLSKGIIIELETEKGLLTKFKIR